METLAPAAVVPSGFPGSAIVRPAIGPRFSTGGPRPDVTRYAFARSGSNSCCGLATVTQPNIAQGSVTALCDRGATAIARSGQYGESVNNSAAGLTMLAYVVSEGRFFALKPSEWSLLLGGVMFCGLLTLVFG